MFEVFCVYYMGFRLKEGTRMATRQLSYRSTILLPHCRHKIYMRYSDLSAFNMDQCTLIQNKSKYITYI